MCLPSRIKPLEIIKMDTRHWNCIDLCNLYKKGLFSIFLQNCPAVVFYTLHAWFTCTLLILHWSIFCRSKTCFSPCQILITSTHLVKAWTFKFLNFVLNKMPWFIFQGKDSAVIMMQLWHMLQVSCRLFGSIQMACGANYFQWWVIITLEYSFSFLAVM